MCTSEWTSITVSNYVLLIFDDESMSKTDHEHEIMEPLSRMVVAPRSTGKVVVPVILAGSCSMKQIWWTYLEEARAGTPTKKVIIVSTFESLALKSIKLQPASKQKGALLRLRILFSSTLRTKTSEFLNILSVAHPLIVLAQEHKNNCLEVKFTKRPSFLFVQIAINSFHQFVARVVKQFWTCVLLSAIQMKFPCLVAISLYSLFLQWNHRRPIANRVMLKPQPSVARHTKQQGSMLI